MGKVIEMLGRLEMTPEHRAHLIQRVADLSVEIALLDSEKRQIERILGYESEE